MLSAIARPSLNTRVRLAQVAGRRTQVALSTGLSQTKADSEVPLSWTKSQPFEHVPWKTPRATQGTIRFLGPTKDGKDAFLNFKKGEEDQTNFGPSIERQVQITDLRHYEPKLSVRTEGIEWVHAPTVLSEDKLLLPNKDEMETFVRGAYFDECAQLVKERTGAAKSLAYNFRHRRIENVRPNVTSRLRVSSKI